MLMSADSPRIFILFAFLVSCFLLSPQGSAREIRGKPIAVLTRTNATANTTNPVPETKAVAAPTKPAKVGDYVEVGFDKLSNYTFAVPEGVQPTNADKVSKSSAQIPAEVKAFDQKKVSLKGFMLPLKVEEGVVTEMLIMKDQSMCCYGAVPRITIRSA